MSSVDVRSLFLSLSQAPCLSIEESKAALLSLRKAIVSYEEELLSAIYLDLGKPRQEAYMCELGLIYKEIDYYASHLARFRKPKRKRGGLASFPSKAYVEARPWGTCLILSPWNYPLLLSLDPLAACLSMGNKAVLKPSEYSPHVSQLIQRIVNEALSDKQALCVLGPKETAEQLTALPFDFVFFTGSSKVGREVYKAASENLTPCVLELGGKSPCLVSEHADLRLAARRIVFGKCLNGGQTCVAPDYVIVDKRVKEPFVSMLKEAVDELYPNGMLGNADYGKIVSSAHLRRLLSLIDRPVLLGGKHNDSQLEFTVIEADFASLSMQEEIFGPLLPVIEYEDLDGAIKAISNRATPLSLYVFTKSRSEAKSILSSLDFGGAVVNDTLMHLTVPTLPFGGKGASGLGSYHGPYSLACFSRETPVLHRGKIDVKLRYPPFSSKKEKLIRKIFR